MAFSRDGERLATGGGDGVARVWELSEGKLAAAVDLGAGITGLQFHPANGRSLLLASTRDGQAALCSLSTNRPLAWLPNDGGPRAAFDPAGELAFHSTTAGLHAFDVARMTNRYVLTNHFAPDQGMVFSRDGRVAIVGGNLRTFDATPFRVSDGVLLSEPVRTRGGTDDELLSPDGSRLAVTAGKAARVWDIGRRHGQGRNFLLGSGAVAWRFLADGKTLLRCDGGGSVHRIQLQFPPVTTTNRVAGTPLLGAAFDGTGRWLAVVTTNAAAGRYQLEVLRLPDGARVAGPWPLAAPPQKVALSADGDFAAAVTGDPYLELHLFDVTRNRPVGPPRDLRPSVLQEGFGRTAFALEFSPDGRRVGVACSYYLAWVFDSATGATMHRLEHSGPVIRLRFSPDGRRFVTVPILGAAQVWDTASGKSNGPPREHAGGTLDAAFSPDGLRLVTCGEDGFVRVTDVERGTVLAEGQQGVPWVACRFVARGRAVAVSAFNAPLLRLFDAGAIERTSDPILLRLGANNDQPLSDPLKLEGISNQILASPDGRWLVHYYAASRAWLFSCGLPDTPVPPWLAELAETLAGLRYDETGARPEIPPAAWLALEPRLRAVPANDEWGRWLRGFLGAER